MTAMAVELSEAAAHAARLRARGDALIARGDAEGGERAHLQALAASTRDPAMVSAANALNKGNIAVCERLLRQHLKSHPTDIGAMRMLAELGIRIGQYGDATALLNRVLELTPSFDAARFARALVFSRLNKLPEAMAEADALLAKAPDNLSYLILRASVLVRLGEYETARALYERVLAARPEQPKIWMSLGHVLKTMGQTQEGVAAYRRSIEQRPELGESWWSLANLKTYKFTANEVSAMEAALGSADADEEDRLHLHFALGKACEDVAEFVRAFDHYAQGNAERRKQIDYDGETITKAVQRMHTALTPDFFAARRAFGHPSSDPVFIVGLPRAGSTLIEQILASHSQVEGTMELPDLDKIARRLAGKAGGDAYPEILTDLSGAECRALGEEYIERTAVQRRLGRARFIDKLPNNWLHVGLIHLILPNAKIVDARRHPMACCFSAWKQHFARGQNFTYDLAELGRYYRDYVALMAHADAILPGRVHRVVHERLVDAPETEIARLLDYLGLPFEQACLEFHHNERAVRTASSEQVRRPISKEGLEQWKNFEAWLEPLAAEIEPVLSTWDH